MTTTVVDPRPELIAEEAGPNQPVLADTFSRVWQTVGNSYESLTTGPAPGNAGRTVAAPHDHGVAGPGAILAQAPSRWQGSAEIVAASAPMPGLTHIYAWASCLAVYAGQDLQVVIFGRKGLGVGLRSPEWSKRNGDLFLELNGADIPFEVVQSQDPSAWVIAAGLGTLAPGVYTLALRLDTPLAAVTSWTVDGAEVWHSGSEQMGLPA